MHVPGFCVSHAEQPLIRCPFHRPHRCVCVADVSKISSRLVSESKKFKWGAKKLNLLDAWKQYAPFVIGFLVLLLVFYWRFF
jgi:hypothetical protein